MVTLAIWNKQRQLSRDALAAEMPYTILIRHDPRANERFFDPKKLNDSNAIYDLMENAWGDTEEEKEATETARKPCQVSRRSVPYVEGGPAPADDYNDIWDVVVPGGVPDEVRVSQVAILQRRADLVGVVQLDEPLRTVYSITAIGQDRLKYIARITMVVYGLRKGT